MTENNIKEESTENILEVGEYQIDGPDNGDIAFDKMTLKATSGAKRVWKVKTFNQKEIVLEVLKFG